jgi:hypothetical protein
LGFAALNPTYNGSTTQNPVELKKV